MRRIIKSRVWLIIAILLTTLLIQLEVLAEDAQEHFKRGHQFYLDSTPLKAEVEFRKALEINPKLSDARYYLGSIYFKQERYAEARKECEQALAINPKDIKSLIILGLSLQQAGEIDAAIDVFQKATCLDNQSAAAHSALGLVYCVKGNLAEAKKEYRLLRKIDPELAEDLLERIDQAGCKLRD